MERQGERLGQLPGSTLRRNALHVDVPLRQDPRTDICGRMFSRFDRSTTVLDTPCSIAASLDAAAVDMYRASRSNTGHEQGAGARYRMRRLWNRSARCGRRAHRVAVDACGAAPLATPPLDRVIHAQHNRTGRNKMADQLTR